MEMWNHHPEEDSVANLAVEYIEDKSHKEGQDNDETKPLVRITSVEDDHSLEQQTSPLSSRFICNDHTEMNREQCAECSLIKDLIRHSPESTIFWHTIKLGPSEGGCHQKYMAHFLTALDDYARDPCLKDEKTTALLKRLLRVDHIDVTARVEYSNFARLVQYFGPIRRNNCIMVKQIHNIVQKSSVFTNKIRKETVSWFAGDMTRDTADSLILDHSSGTYLVRMSQTFPGCFVVSVTSGGSLFHIAIEADVATALRSDPYNANLRLHGLVYPSLVEAAQSLKTRILETEDGLEIMCRKCCPNLAINAIISGYRKSTKRR
ncbi:uncharacterized protein LOC110454325 isoform X1 [Mizuhopecten yessoensis]|uniref:Dual specificity protein kinase shkC n=1 Tax=Mizuhopecten yessoensis TaxID=6573 RepID=A0A210QFI0_MIZYE|nr:uncharacterized protein LOC110454325 isoform X1 [Mizuhopecten yessoensis]XP_021359451.1 uncharacterized protein LOC110454325 isoform X1 [Mizuhopecten yessoensis]OWF47500.1 Dual specificity protein kinase shkC [Mizuhopecten yessoensis]